MAIAATAKSWLRANCSNSIFVSAGLIMGEKKPARIVVAEGDARGVRGLVISDGLPDGRRARLVTHVLDPTCS